MGNRQSDVTNEQKISRNRLVLIEKRLERNSVLEKW